MTTPSAQTMISRADVLWRRVLDGVLVRAIGSPANILIEGTGVAMWDLLETPISFDNLCRTLAASHDAPLTVVSADVSATVIDLEARGVLEVV